MVVNENKGFVSLWVDDGADKLSICLWPETRHDGSTAIVDINEDVAVLMKEAECVKLRDMLNSRFPVSLFPVSVS